MNVDTLLAAMPGLARSTATSYLPFMEAAQREFGVTNQLRCYMWLAQVGHESASLKYMEEIASGAAYEGRLDLGNTQPGDGVRFKGRGPIQLTGRANYTAAGNALNLPLVSNPPMAAQPQYAFRVSAWWWWSHGLNAISDTGDVVAATRRINGGTNGLADRQSRYTKCRGLGAAVLPGEVTPSPPPEPEDKEMIISSTPSGKGYIVVKPDGAVFAFGDAGYFGGANQAGHLAAGDRITDAAYAATGGYFLVAKSGALFAYGNVQYVGGPNDLPQ